MHIIQATLGVVVDGRAAVAVLALLRPALALAAVFFAGTAGLERFGLEFFEGVFFGDEVCARFGTAVGEGGAEGGKEEGG